MFDFMICGLPRSRTAWLAAFMHGDGVFCHHEVMRKEIVRPDCKVFGSSETMGLLYPERAKKIVSIHRDYADVKRSVYREFGVFMNDEVCLFWVDKLNALPGLHFDFRDLDAPENIRKLYDYCTDGLPFPEAKWQLFKDLKINTKRTFGLETYSWQL